MAPIAPADARTGGMETQPEGDVRIEPFDQFNQELVANVHPAGWVNPEPRERYHLVVIGAGTGGLVTASIAAAGGAASRCERYLMGGDCLTVGCVPSKGIISAAPLMAGGRRSRRRFGGPAVSGTGRLQSGDGPHAPARAGLSRIDGAPRYRDLGVDVFLGEGRFTRRDTADGGRPRPPIPPVRDRYRHPAGSAAHPGPRVDRLPHQRTDHLRLDRAASGGSPSSALGRSAAACPGVRALGSAVTVIDQGAQSCRGRTPTWR